MDDMSLLDEIASHGCGDVRKADEKAEAPLPPFTSLLVNATERESFAHTFSESSTTSHASSTISSSAITDAPSSNITASASAILQAGRPPPKIQKTSGGSLFFSTPQTADKQDLCHKEISASEPSGVMTELSVAKADKSPTRPEASLAIPTSSDAAESLALGQNAISQFIYPQNTVNMCPTTDKLVLPAAGASMPSTALPTRTTEVVMAELKKLTRESTNSLIAEPTLISLHILPSVSSINDHPTSNEDDEEDYDHRSWGEDENADEDWADLPTFRSKKITERKRRQNAIADIYLQQALQDPAKKHKLLPEDELNQSTRYMVNQQESQQIISTPREYQIELFERAKEKNIIAVLDTGSGKTLIAVLLLRYVISQELEDRALGKPKRISFFLVDSVTLVFQQHAVLKANLDQPMNMFCGDMGCDLWSRKLWEKHFHENMVIVCTAEVLRQCLHHSFISMAQINLLIFDEAHHAKKDHAYARIIKDFFATEPAATRPKIFGMTASPVDARVDVKKAAFELETMLHSEIATAADSSMMQYSINPQIEQLAKYDPLGPRFKTSLYEQMYQRFKGNKILRKPLEYAFDIASRELGAWCADELWKFCLAEEESKRLLAKTERQWHAKKVPGPLALLEQQKVQLQEALRIVRAHNFEKPDFDPNEKYSKNLSSKVVLLARYLNQRYERPTEDKCIVFVKQRYTARLLATLFSQPNMRTPNLFVSSLVGTRQGDAADLNNSFREQIITMLNFRKGTINCLFATSVAEEGLDVPNCNLVIRFDLYDTTIQYIQSRGRARHVNSRYIHMAEAGNQVQIQTMIEARKNEGIIKKFCNALPEDRKLYGNDSNMDKILSKERNHRVYKNETTGAKLTYKMSLSILANFVDSLPCGHEENLQPEYVITAQKGVFVGEVVMPDQSPIRGAVGLSASTKQVAKCSAAFETCLRLIEGSYLDENLLPTYTKQLPIMRNALLAVDSKKREAYGMKVKPTLWSVGGFPDELYVTIMSLVNPGAVNRQVQPLALLTRSRLPDLPSFFLHFGDAKNSPVKLTSLRNAIKVDAFMLKRINAFTLCLFDDVFSKCYEPDPSKMPYFLTPVLPRSDFNIDLEPSSLIAWDVVESVASHYLQWEENKGWETMKPWQTEADAFFVDKFVTDPYDGSRKLWCKGVAPQYKPLDPVPSNTAPHKSTKGRRSDNIMEYSCSLWEKARSRRTLDENQRVFKAELVSLRRNLLDEFEVISESQTPKQCFVTLETLKVSPIPTVIVSMAYLFPAIIHRTESYLIALEACELLHLKIRPDLALEAVTKDSDNSDEHDAEKIDFQSGMGNNYERLEFLGDCFLKMATSIALYGIHPGHDEYEYHVDRMLLICNKNLKNNAIKLKLYEYIRSQSFSRRAWYPQGLVLRKGKAAAAPNSHKLSDKSIADVCEALIGAALLTCHESGDMDNAVRAVTELVSSENHNITSYAQYYTLYKKPSYQIQASTESQLNLARQVEQEHNYRFKWPRLVRSAFSHPSYPFLYEKVPSYQRLEFLGDALLDMACVNYLFHKYPSKDPQWLTEHKMAMVSNQFLGAVCVAMGFHRHLLLFNSKYQKQISDYVTEVNEARRQAEADAVREGKTAVEFSPDYWTDVRQPPKCLPDIVEAYVGAMFVDSEYNYFEVERFFDEHIKPYFTDMSIYDTYANKHPTTFLASFLQVNMGCTNWTTIVKEIKRVDGGKPTVFAMVMIHDQVIADARAESARYAKVAAAKKAIEILKGLPLMEYREKYGCACRPEDADESKVHAVAGNAV